MHYFRLFSLQLCLIAFYVLHAQTPPTNVMIMKADPLKSYGPCEPSISINPTNPNEVVAGSVLNNFHYSSDRGTTWHTGTLTSPYGVWGDPVLIHDYTGRAYFAHLSNESGKGWADSTILDKMVVQWSDDGGKTWADGSYAVHAPPKDQDKEWLAVHPTADQVVMTWTQFDKYGSANPTDKTNILFSSSTDKGQTWTEPIAINEKAGDCLDGDQTTEGAVPSIDRHGTIYVAWAYDEKIYLDRSTDGGHTWLENDIEVADQPDGWDFDDHISGIGRCNGMPVTSVALAGEHTDRVYVCWSDLRNGSHDADIYITHSDDKGEHWSSPMRVNTDQTATQQFLPWMTTDPATGYIYIVYYDRSTYSDTRTDVVLAVSTDGGDTFETRTISESPFIPTSSAFFGDYNHISAYDGMIRPIWTRLDDGTLSVWTALIDQK